MIPGATLVVIPEAGHLPRRAARRGAASMSWRLWHGGEYSHAELVFTEDAYPYLPEADTRSIQGQPPHKYYMILTKVPTCTTCISTCGAPRRAWT